MSRILSNANPYHLTQRDFMKSLLSFILFLTVFFMIYSSLHYYFYRKLNSAVVMGPLCNGLLLVFLLVMLLSPVLINVSIKHGNYLLTTSLAYIGYTWMGALFLFFSIHFLIDIYTGIFHFSSRIFSPVFIMLNPGNRVSFVITLIMVIGIIIYGRFEAEKIEIETVALQTDKLPPGTRSLRIVQISDIHFSVINNVRLARKIVDKIEGLSPDILVSTGDLIDRGLEEKGRVAELFRSLKVPYGKYAVTGNHEFYTGVEGAVKWIEKAGFRMLRNEGITAGDIVNIAGVDDPTARRFGHDVSISEDEILKKFSDEKLTILLKHQPKISAKSSVLFDLQLSGHTHNGQIFPFSLLTSLFFPYHKGLFMVGKHSYLYVSRGTGTWGPPVRFLSSPEVTLIEFQNHFSSVSDSEK